MYYKKAICYFMITFINMMILFPTIIYLRDPYNLFHQNSACCNKIYKDLRISDYNLIRDGNFDSIILGSSMLQNTSAYEAAKKLGGDWANLSFSGARSFEKFKIINYAQKHIDLKNVIISIDEHFKPNTFEKNFYPQLYDDNILAKFNIYLTDKALLCMIYPSKCEYIETDTDSPTAWKDIEDHIRRFGGFGNWLRFYDDDSQIQDAVYTLLSVSTCDDTANYFVKTVDDEMMPLFKNHNTQFHLIIPPYSALYWAHHFDNIDCKMAPYRYLIEKSAAYDNIHIYWLYDEDFVFDIANYKDLTHYHPKINSIELDYIKQKSHIITPKNYKQKLQNFKRKLKNFDLQYYMNQIRKISPLK